MAGPLIGDGAIIEARWPYRVNGQICLLVRHYRLHLLAGVSVDSLVVLNEALTALNGGGGASDVGGAMSNVLAQDVTIDNPVMQVIWPARYNSVIGLAATASGNVAFDALPPGTSWAFTVRGAAAGKLSRGIVHQGGVPKDSFSAGRLAGTLAGPSAATFRDSIVANYPATGGTWLLVPVIFHRADPSLSVTIVDYIWNDIIRTMRRRVIGRGK